LEDVVATISSPKISVVRTPVALAHGNRTPAAARNPPIAGSAMVRDHVAP
jgi:hypothetical protein